MVSFFFCFAHAVFLSFFFSFFFFFVVIQMTIWYANKSIQNIILNENYIINKSIVLTDAVFFFKAKGEISRTRHDRRLLHRLSNK